MTRSTHPMAAALARLTKNLLIGAKALALCLTFVVSFAPVGAAHAQEFEVEHLRLGAQLAEITGANRLFVNALNSQRRDIIRAVVSTNPDVAETVTEVVDLAYVDMAETAESLFRDIAQIYATAYSQEELAQILAFFQSDVGQAYVTNQRATDQAVLAATVAWGDGVSVDFLARVRELLGERGVEF